MHLGGRDCLTRGAGRRQRGRRGGREGEALEAGREAGARPRKRQCCRTFCSVLRFFGQQSTHTKHELVDSQPPPLFQVLLLVCRDTSGITTSKPHFLPPSCTSVLSLLWIKPRSVHILSPYSTTQAYLKPPNFVFYLEKKSENKHFFLNLKLRCHYKNRKDIQKSTFTLIKITPNLI